MKRILKSNIKKHLIANWLYFLTLFFIFLSGVLLRFIQAPDRYGFDGDAIRDAIVAFEGAKTLAFPLIGPFSSTGPYTFGPWYFIFIILSALFFPIPYAPWVFLGLLSLITMLLMADIGRLLYSKTFGLLLAFLTAIAPTQINVGTGLSNLHPIIFFTTLSLWIALKLMNKEASYWLWYFCLGLVLGFGINMHYQMVGLVLLPLLLWLRMGWTRIDIPLLIFLGLFITFIPLLIFNLQTNWSTLNGLNEMLIAKERTYVPNSWNIYLFQFWVNHFKFHFFTSTIFNGFLLLLFVAAFVLNLLKKKYSQGLVLFALIFGANFLWLRYYWGERHDVYLYYLTPLLFIFLGYALFSLVQMKYGKILFIILLCILSGAMLKEDYKRIIGVSGSEHLVWIKEADMLQNKYPNTNIVLYSCDRFYEAHKHTLLYMLSFHRQPKAEEKKIGLFSQGCQYPYVKTFGKLKEAYPFLFPEIKDTNFNFIDLSQASPSVIEKAGWKQITSRDIFNATVNWWR